MLYLVHVDGGTKVEASVATAVATIHGASAEQKAVAKEFCIKIIDASMRGLRVPGGEEGLAAAR